MLHRQIETLAYCAALKTRPTFIPRNRAKGGSKGAGLAYERKVGRYLGRLFPAVKSGLWFEFLDGNGKGWCQIDHFVRLEDQVLLVECKLAEREEAWTQMSQLYVPVLERLYKLPVTQVQACKILRTRRAIIEDVRGVVPGRKYLWHFLG